MYTLSAFGGEGPLIRVERPWPLDSNKRAREAFIPDGAKGSIEGIPSPPLEERAPLLESSGQGRSTLIREPGRLLSSMEPLAPSRIYVWFTKFLLFRTRYRYNLINYCL